MASSLTQMTPLGPEVAPLLIITTHGIPYAIEFALQASVQTPPCPRAWDENLYSTTGSVSSAAITAVASNYLLGVSSAVVLLQLSGGACSTQHATARVVIWTNLESREQREQGVERAEVLCRSRRKEAKKEEARRRGKEGARCTTMC
jgi:hypothetical protein